LIDPSHLGTDVLEGTKNPAVTMDVVRHTNPKMMMRYQHPEYTMRRVKPSIRGMCAMGLGQLLGQVQNKALGRVPKCLGIWSRRSDLNR
jgi:hypothetical protein